MSTVLVAAILVGIPVLIIMLFIMNENRKKLKYMNQFITRFSELGAQNNLTFSSQDILKYSAIGLDGIHRKLLVLTGGSETTCSNSLIYLNDVKSISVKSDYGTIKPSGLKGKELEHYLQKVVLRFEFIKDQAPVEITFYHRLHNDVNELKQLSEKAKYWEAILTKMLKRSTKETVETKVNF